jgi:hypothetical protein
MPTYAPNRKPDWMIPSRITSSGSTTAVNSTSAWPRSCEAARDGPLADREATGEDATGERRHGMGIAPDRMKGPAPSI